VNHLAHLALAAPVAAHMVGGFPGDHVKGPLHGERPAAVEAGIRLHRFIDATTNRDPVMKASAARFGAAHRRAAPILVDIVADHFLARSFTHWHGTALPAFTAHAYRLLAEHGNVLPTSADLLRQRLTAGDGLAAYTDLAVVEYGFARVALRLHRPHDSLAWRCALDVNYQALQVDFDDYYPRLLALAQTWLQRLREADAPSAPVA